MKLRTWLLITYALAMILPLIAGYILFAWISHYNQQQTVDEVLLSKLELTTVERVVNDPALYQRQADRAKVEALVNDQRMIVLYDAEGRVLFNPSPLKLFESEGAQQKIYENLYQLKRNYKTYHYRAPVLVNRQVVGFYEVIFYRSDWQEGVANRTWLVVGIFSVIILSIFSAIFWLSNCKFTYRLQNLQQQMLAFGQGKVIDKPKTKPDEIGQLARSFYQMQNKIRDTQQSLREEQQQKQMMMASLSHDLKTPLTSIRAYTEAIQHNELSKQEQAEYTTIIIEKSQYMKQMLDDLTTYATLQSPQFMMDKVSVDGEEFFDMLLSDYETLCQERQLQLRTRNYACSIYEVNPKQMMRVMDNMMMNAIQHAEHHIMALVAEKAQAIQEMPLSLHPYFEEELLYVVVQNDGTLIQEEVITQIFNPLYQADLARTKAGNRGNGLGLSITKQIIEKHGGTVQIVSNDVVGTVLICALPKGE